MPKSKTHPYLKGLAETRARAAGDYEKASQAIAERTRVLQHLTQQFEISSRVAVEALSAAEKQAATAMTIREACDQLIFRLNNELAPEDIEPISAWQGRYGRRGALSQAIQQIIEVAYPAEVSTGEITAKIQEKFGLSFGTGRERRLWKRVSILGRLKILADKGLIERLHDTTLGATEPGRWRALPSQYAPDSLIDFATKAGIPLTFMSDAFSLEDTSDANDDDLPR